MFLSYVHVFNVQWSLFKVQCSMLNVDSGENTCSLISSCQTRSFPQPSGFSGDQSLFVNFQHPVAIARRSPGREQRKISLPPIDNIILKPFLYFKFTLCQTSESFANVGNENLKKRPKSFGTFFGNPLRSELF